MMYFLTIFGLALLFGAAEILLRGSVAAAHWLKISPFLIGLTVVSFATSAPELAVCLDAASKGHPDIAIANVVGSNTANILFILGFSALVKPLVWSLDNILRDGFVMVSSALLLVFLGLYGHIDRLLGVCMFLGLGAYLVYCYRKERSAKARARRNPKTRYRPKPDKEEALTVPTNPFLIIGFLLGGLTGLAIGSQMLVAGAVELALAFNLSQTVIGLTLVAVGTSIPELVTSILAAFRRHPDVVIGNIIGSNIFNILGVLGVTTALMPLNLGPHLVLLDLWVMLLATAVLFLFLIRRWQMNRLVGAGFLIAYGAYMALLYKNGVLNLGTPL